MNDKNISPTFKHGSAIGQHLVDNANSAKNYRKNCIQIIGQASNRDLVPYRRSGICPHQKPKGFFSVDRKISFSHLDFKI